MTFNFIKKISDIIKCRISKDSIWEMKGRAADDSKYESLLKSSKNSYAYYRNSIDKGEIIKCLDYINDNSEIEWIAICMSIDFLPYKNNSPIYKVYEDKVFVDTIKDLYSLYLYDVMEINLFNNIDCNYEEFKNNLLEKRIIPYIKSINKSLKEDFIDLIKYSMNEGVY